MKKLIFVFSAFLCASMLNAQWIQDSIPTTDWLYNIHDAGDNTIYVSGSYGRIYKSKDRGASWAIRQIQTQRETGAAYFINANTGFAITGDNGIYGGDIYKTTNGGLNWESKFSSSNISFRHALHFINANTGYAGGWSLSIDTAIFKTTDGGETWQTLIISGLYGIDKFSFINAETGWAVGYGNNKRFVLKTTNGGANWVIIYTDTEHTNFFMSLQFLNENTGWIVGLKNMGPSLIRKTTDGGSNWTDQTHNHTTNWELYDIQMMNENTGWIVGDVGVIIKTTNGGTNWRAQENPFYGNALFGVHFFSADTGIAVGMSGIIIKTLNGGGPVAVTTISSEVPSAYSLSQNYPNPFNPVTKIKYAISRSSFVRLTVYDAIGHEIETLVNVNQSPGIYETVFNASALSSGVYFYRLTAGNFSETRKMVVLK